MTLAEERGVRAVAAELRGSNSINSQHLRWHIGAISRWKFPNFLIAASVFGLYLPGACCYRKASTGMMHIFETMEGTGRCGEVNRDATSRRLHFRRHFQR